MLSSRVREMVLHADWMDWRPRFLWRWLDRRTEDWGEPIPTQEDRRIADYFANLPSGEHTVIVYGPGSALGLAHLKVEGGMLWELPDGRVLNVIPHIKRA